MWKLSARGARGTPFTDLGSCASLADAAEMILKAEGDPQSGSLFFRVYVDPLTTGDDAEALSRLEYQSPKRFYLLERNAH